MLKVLPPFFRRYGARAGLALAAALLFTAARPAGHAMPRSPAPPASCDNLLLPPRDAKGHKVGPSSCLMQETSLTVDGRALTRLDIGLDGTVDGYLAKTGDYKDYFTNGPDLVFPQTWGARPIFFGIAKYERLGADDRSSRRQGVMERPSTCDARLGGR